MSLFENLATFRVHGHVILRGKPLGLPLNPLKSDEMFRTPLTFPRARPPVILLWLSGCVCENRKAIALIDISTAGWCLCVHEHVCLSKLKLVDIISLISTTWMQCTAIGLYL